MVEAAAVCFSSSSTHPAAVLVGVADGVGLSSSGSSSCGSVAAAVWAKLSHNNCAVSTNRCVLRQLMQLRVPHTRVGRLHQWQLPRARVGCRVVLGSAQRGEGSLCWAFYLLLQHWGSWLPQTTVKLIPGQLVFFWLCVPGGVLLSTHSDGLCVCIKVRDAQCRLSCFDCAYV